MKPSGIKMFCITFILLPIFLAGQENSLDQFKTTKSVGEPPKIFKETFEERIEDSKGKVTEVEEKYKDDFVRYSNYSLRNLLKSGYILYGDPMTNFVQSVGNNLLRNHPDLKNEIQFYVIKNNITNALCTEPGVIFITTGLLSQIENEAQLAYVIAHEIVHYQEKHLQKSFNKSKASDLNASTSYQDQVTLSKDHEFEADVNALRLYHAAGYSEKEVHTVFDVLMYSYLTFDEIEIDSTFFGNPTIHIPQSYFPEKANPILAFEDYDDSKSTHPNIRKRKDSISGAIRKYDNWGVQPFLTCFI
ncbi:MAG TPA: M48 family metalloprotease [Brumimicrobium sp.]|nr:M48 family metalloprotease [Brumimicrobium sp.]